jgi:hypothetical protein
VGELRPRPQKVPGGHTCGARSYSQYVPGVQVVVRNVLRYLGLDWHNADLSYIGYTSLLQARTSTSRDRISDKPHTQCLVCRYPLGTVDRCLHWSILLQELEGRNNTLGNSIHKVYRNTAHAQRPWLQAKALGLPACFSCYGDCHIYYGGGPRRCGYSGSM